MAGGVTLKSLHVEGSQGNDHLIIVTLSILADDEIEAAQWVLDALGRDQ